MTLYILEDSDGSAKIASIRDGGAAPAPLAAGKRVRAVSAGEVLPPGALSTAWRYQDTALTVDMAAARTAWTATLTTAATIGTARLQAGFMTAMMTGDFATQSAIQGQVQALHSAAATDLSGAGTAADLIAIRPAALAGYLPPT